MNKGYGQGDERLAEYAERVFIIGREWGESELLADVRARQQAAGMPDIAVGLMDGLHLEVLTRAVGARRAVEIGTLGGWSGACIARGLAEGGRLDTFEIEESHAAVARQTFARAGLSDRVRIHVGPASLRLADIETDGPFDLVFIDADKVAYPIYLAWAARNLRVGGVVLGDNAFGWGHVVSPGLPTSHPDSPGVRALLSFNEALARGGRFRATMLPTGEGLAMGVKIR